MTHKDTEIWHLAEDILENLHIDDAKEFIKEYGDEIEIKKLEELL